MSIMQFPFSSSLKATHRTGRSVRWCVGIDGGGTSTRALIADDQGRVIGRGDAAASALNQGIEQAWRHIVQAIDRSNVPGLMLRDCALGLGISGTDVPEQLRVFVDSAPDVAQFSVLSDGFAALLGAHGGQSGALMISGTGSVAEALLPNGTHRMVGGWGWQIGDEGSGAWLGQKVMKLAQAAYDNRAVAGPLVQSLWMEVGTTRERLLSFCARAGQAAYAGLAPLAFEHDGQDQAATEMLDEAARALEALASALHPTLPMAIAGSVALRLASRFSSGLQSRIVAPKGDAASGALWLAQQMFPAAPG